MQLPSLYPYMPLTMRISNLDEAPLRDAVEIAWKLTVTTAKLCYVTILEQPSTPERVPESFLHASNYTRTP
jgi:hypothetical protein